LRTHVRSGKTPNSFSLNGLKKEMLLLYIDPGTGGAIFQGLSTLLAALGGGVAVLAAFFLRPVRRLFRTLWRLVRGGGGEEHEK